ncbi:hypothetical protein GJ496_011617 [Pomphorhynchus laevis]|nr:hypothetical protein GJ496_011617 [Pomphorhynchus laevis]
MADSRLLEMSEDMKQDHRLNSSGSHISNRQAGVFTRIIRPMFAEFIGTTFYLLTGLLTITHARSALPVAVTFGISLAAYLACFGHISGGHFNPATTTAVFVAGEVHIILALMYIVIQLIGGIAAAALAKLLIVPVSNVVSVGDNDDLLLPGGATSIFLHGIDHLRTTWWKALIAEAIFTMTFTFVILMTTKDRMSKTGLAPFLVGLTLSVCMLALTSVSGGQINPARSFGCAVVLNNWKYHFIFWAGPLIGAVLAGLLYRFIFSHGHIRFTRKAGNN